MSESIPQRPPSTPAIFIDAAGTLIRIRDRVGTTYSRIANSHGLRIDPESLDVAFRATWKSLPPPQHEGAPSPDDDKSWWLELVRRCFHLALGNPLPSETLSPLFEDLYAFYARPEAWDVYPDVVPALKLLHPRFRLHVLSNFDRRLFSILDSLQLKPYFEKIIISSEVGASKPSSVLFAAAARAAHCLPENCIHIGDDPECDFKGARNAGFRAYHLDRKTATLHDIARLITEEDPTTPTKVRSKEA